MLCDPPNTHRFPTINILQQSGVFVPINENTFFKSDYSNGAEYKVLLQKSIAFLSYKLINNDKWNLKLRI